MRTCRRLEKNRSLIRLRGSQRRMAAPTTRAAGVQPVGQQAMSCGSYHSSGAPRNRPRLQRRRRRVSRLIRTKSSDRSARSDSVSFRAEVNRSASSAGDWRATCCRSSLPGISHPEEQFAASLEPPAGHGEKGGLRDIVSAPHQDGLRLLSPDPLDHRTPGQEGVGGLERPIPVASKATTHVVHARSTIVERAVTQVVRYAARGAGHTVGAAGGAETSLRAFSEGDVERFSHRLSSQIAGSCGSPRPVCAQGRARSVLDDTVLAQDPAGLAGDEFVLDLAHAAGRRGVGIAFSIDGEAAQQAVLHDG